MDNDINKMPGYQLFASVGKKVLRPGGLKLTSRLIKNLNITAKDIVVEFAPGLGKTAKLALQKSPAEYIGVELDEAYANRLRKRLSGNIQIINTTSANTGLPNNYVSKVYGEAMLTMQADHRKAEIIVEANRILKSGGFYGIHELVLSPDNIGDEKKAEIQKALAQVMHVNARPLTITEWTDLLKDGGFTVIKTELYPMELLNVKRIIADEGFFRAVKIGFNILSSPKKLERIKAIKSVLKKYQKYLKAVAIISQKTQ